MVCFLSYSTLIFSRLQKHHESPCRQFPLPQDAILLTDFYPLACERGVSKKGREFALLYYKAIKKKMSLHKVAFKESDQLDSDLLSRRQAMLDQIVPQDLDEVK